MNNLPKVVAQQRHGRASNPRPLDRKSDALPLSHRATLLTHCATLSDHHYHRKYWPLPNTFPMPNQDVSVTAAAAFVMPLTCQSRLSLPVEGNSIPLVEFTRLPGMNLASAPDSNIRALAG